jgi:7,8-dihydropterin-6-yl-methyl-4-(beta-D-ribofuranosyl)aminobenzene 5'-phosphate synthase
VYLSPKLQKHSNQVFFKELIFKKYFLKFYKLFLSGRFKMKNTRMFLLMVLISFISITALSQRKKDFLKVIPEKSSIKVTILYDNTINCCDTRKSWGFSCLIEGTEKTILFDAGESFDTLLYNMKKLKLDFKRIDQIVVSHTHHDHIGGLNKVLQENKKVELFLPELGPDSLNQKIDLLKIKTVIVDSARQICKDVLSTGRIGGGMIDEQTLIITTSKGLVIITGCAHPGIIKIIKKSKELLKQNIYMVLGGFHLLQTPESDVKNIINEFKEMGVQYCGATHCTGENVIKMFQQAYGDSFVNLGTGRVIDLVK